MLSRKSITTALSCNNCNYRVLADFAASASIQLRPLKPLRLLPLPQRQTFRAIARKAAESDINLLNSTDAAHDDRSETAIFSESLPPVPEPEPEASDNLTETYTPWYLQEHTAQVKQDQSPYAERQRIPDLPENPPPALRPILQHISTDLGLDDLSLLDLRHLDPPPALGSNLIMIIGTARSEKHLHVSADRHCRWLRSTYKMHPSADGLLGRNEMKLKLRRKARRSKMLRNVGASEGVEADEDLHTGWVCVNIGKVEPAASQLEMEREQEQESQGFVGFGSRFEGVRLVVQMFTENKRAQFDLETLWGGVLRRRAAKEKEGERETVTKVEASNSEEEDENKPQAIEVQGNHEEYHRIPAQGNLASLQRQLGLGNQQVRAYHSHKAAFHASEMEGRGLPDSFDLSTASESSIDPSEASLIHESTPNQTDSARSLQFLLQNLQSAPEHQAREMLQVEEPISAWSTPRSPFMESFTNNFPPFPDASHWQSLIALALMRVKIFACNRRNLLQDLISVQQAGEHITRETYLEVLGTVAEAKSDARTTAYIFEILDMMTYEGYSILDEDVFHLLHKAIGRPYAHPSSFVSRNEESTANPTPEVNHSSEPGQSFEDKERVLATMDHFLITFDSDASYYSLLESYANDRYWPGFLSVWSSLPRRMRSRSRKMYNLFYETLANSGNKNLISDVLHDAISDMAVEEPPVEFDSEIAEQIASCVKVAVPDIEGSMENRKKPMGEWATIWGRCQRALSM